MTSPPLPARSVQTYLDETPLWRDGTPLSATPLTAMQWRIWALATTGKCFEGMVVFMTGVALPLMVRDFDLSDWTKGIVIAAPLFGILIGATALGGLADHYGRKTMFILEMVLFVFFLAAILFVSNWIWLSICLLGMGLALGCDYPTAHLVISESIPSRARGRLVLGAFAFQAVGALLGTVIGVIVLYLDPQLGAWRWMYAVALIPAILVVFARFFIPSSPHWLVAKGRMDDAQRAMQSLLHRHPAYPAAIHLSPDPAQTDDRPGEPPAGSWAMLLHKQHRRRLILASAPWFLQDLSTYGIGIFTPTILASMFGHGRSAPRSVADVVHNDLLAARGAAFIDVLLLAGIAMAIVLADRVGRMRLQIMGFIGCAAGLVLAAMGASHEQTTTGFILIFAGFMLFSFMTNIGPNAMTYLIAGEVFPTAIRGKGAGLAASVGKVGAVLTALLFPVLLAFFGVQWVLILLVGCSLLGAWVTWHYRIETAGMNLESLTQDSDRVAGTPNGNPHASATYHDPR